MLQWQAAPHQSLTANGNERAEGPLLQSLNYKFIPLYVQKEKNA
jgi:hypothetical protein